ncbi:unnamed protein product [Heterosigma akashiwo]
MSLWHHRLSHASESLIRQMAADGTIPSHLINLSDKLPFCTSCCEMNMPKKGPISNGASRNDSDSPVVSRILQEVSVDVSGPFPKDRSGNCWFVLFVDRKLRFRTVGLMKNKNDSFQHFLSFCQAATRSHPDISVDDVATIRMDGGDTGGEFSDIRAYADQHGI